MSTITHTEVRRHPRWREELRTPLSTDRAPTGSRTGLLMVVAVLIVATAIAVVILN